MKDYIKRFSKLIFGLLLFSFGYYLAIQANVGLAPWSAFSMGVAKVTGSTYGMITSLTAIAIMIIDLFLKEKIGWGTVFDTIMIGPCVDLFTRLNLVPMLENFWIGVLLMIISNEIVAVGSYFYIGSAMSAGPRDTLMVALCKKMPKVPIGVVRCMIEGTALIVGWICGAKVGLGTVIAVFLIGIMIQWTFQVLKL